MLRPTAIPEIPAATACIARTAFPKGTSFLRLRDELGILFTEQDFAQFIPNAADCGYPVAVGANHRRLDLILPMMGKRGCRRLARAQRLRWGVGLPISLTGACWSSRGAPAASPVPVDFTLRAGVYLTGTSSQLLHKCRQSAISLLHPQEVRL
ncbi:hypothetical protein GCM10010840_27320 [Deinococcus aerolatus]|uniref:Uncharacterized protein n=1 Tax=Deinococcus aerolatus TaxID=522487 RepID=A0ABQ2GDP2_9DEIO|nr:hypothetical protein GCM10010840_27320 [Deinococcus aerolatus]